MQKIESKLAKSAANMPPPIRNVMAPPPQNSVAAAIEEIKRNGRGGCTFSCYALAPCDRVDVNTGYLVSLLSVRIPLAKLTVGRVEAIIATHEKLATAPWVYCGIYCAYGSNVVSFDFNIALKSRDLAIQIGRANDQIAIWDCAAGEEIETGRRGENVIKTEAQAMLIAKMLEGC